MIERIASILKKNNCQCTGLTESTELIADLGLNSLKIVQLAAGIEDEFDIEIPDRAIKDLKTIGDVIRLIESLS